jgi:hypothetical protein
MKPATINLFYIKDRVNVTSIGRVGIDDEHAILARHNQFLADKNGRGPGSIHYVTVLQSDYDTEHVTCANVERYRYDPQTLTSSDA